MDILRVEKSTNELMQIPGLRDFGFIKAAQTTKGNLVLHSD